MKSGKYWNWSLVCLNKEQQHLAFCEVSQVTCATLDFNPGGPLKLQEGVSGSSMDSQKAP